jgi:hypothetical protein
VYNGRRHRGRDRDRQPRDGRRQGEPTTREGPQPAGDGEEQSTGTVNEVGREGAQTADEGEEELRPLRRRERRSHMGAGLRRRPLHIGSDGGQGGRAAPLTAGKE